MAQLTVLHTNDFHNRLTPREAEQLRLAKERSDALLLDAGDAVWAGNVYFRPGGEPILETMSQAGYDAMTIGNREFHFSETGFRCKLSRATYTVLCANIRARDGASLPCTPTAVFQRGGLAVGILGVTVAMVTQRMRAAAFSAYLFGDPLQAAVDAARRLRDSCDAVIALNHIGLAQDRLLAERCEGMIDLIVGGHSHDETPEPLVVAGVPIVQAGAYARVYGEVTMQGGRGAWEVSSRLIPLKGPRE